MRFLELETGFSADPDFVYLKDVPAGTETERYRMSEGDRMGADYPADAVVQMGPESYGVTLPTLISNIFSFLIVRRDLKDVLVATGVDLEALPFTLLDARQRVMSRDYFIVNPIGVFDCIDEKASVIRYSKRAPSVIIAIDKLVLDPRKLEKAPDLFRIARDPRRYVISQQLAARIAALNPTNVQAHLLEQSAP